MSFEDIGLKALEILSPILLAALAWLASKAAALITAKVQNEYLRGVLVRVDDAVYAAVRELQQVTVEAIKAASADGTLTPEEREKVKQAALDSVKSHLGMKGLVELARVLGLSDGAVEKLLSTRIEAAVFDMKASRPTASDAPLVAPTAPAVASGVATGAAGPFVGA
jgi:hypothetical protein